MPEGLHPFGPARRKHHAVDEIPQNICHDPGYDTTKEQTAHVYLSHSASLKSTKVLTTAVSHFTDVSLDSRILSVGLCRRGAENRPEGKELSSQTRLPTVVKMIAPDEQDY